MFIAVGQISIAWENKAKNLEKAVTYIVKAKQQGADLILFPEMSLTGFSMNVTETGEDDSATVRMFSSLAREHQIAIGIGWVKKNAEKAENHYSMIGVHGEVLFDYTKIHPFSFAGEDQYFIPGQEFVSGELCGRTLSAVICYDLRFPEIFQILSKKADILLVPANWPEKRENHWKTLLQARAIESQSYIVGINCVGTIGGIDYSGSSMVISPEGKILGSLGCTEGLLCIEIPDDVQRCRELFPVKNDRREALYYTAYVSSPG